MESSEKKQPCSQSRDETAEAPPEPLQIEPSFDLPPEAVLRQASLLASVGDRREAVDLLRSAIEAAEAGFTDAEQMQALLDSLAELLWQLDERDEAKLYANRALQVRLSAR